MGKACSLLHTLRHFCTMATPPAMALWLLISQVKEDEQEAAKLDAVFPCVLKIMPTCVFNKKDPIVLGVEVVDGIAKIGTPLCVPTQVGWGRARVAGLR